MNRFSSGKLADLGNSIRMPDDVTMGYLIEKLLRVRLTVVAQFHSHLENMKEQQLASLPYQVRVITPSCTKLFRKKHPTTQLRNVLLTLTIVDQSQLWQL